MDPAAELEGEQKVRVEEIVFLQNICNGLQSNDQKDRMRRSMVVMLYSHFEGFAKFALELYRRNVDERGLKCREVQPVLATCALKDLFKAVRGGDQGKTFLPKTLQLVQELRPIAVERAFVENAWDFGERTASIPEDFVDTESNLKPVVLQKNLFRLGLPHDLFDSIEGNIHRLLNYRNKIAHGGSHIGVDEADYNELYNTVIQVMDELKRTILSSIANQAFRRTNRATALPP